MSLFEGYAEAYGTHGATKKSASKGGKLEIKASAKTLREPVTVQLWERHLAGDLPIGIIPIRDNFTCLWGVIDVDQYDLSHSEIVDTVKKEELPLILCRSKSGGAHLFLFMAEPVSAELMRTKLAELAAILGYGSSEIFPKQTNVMLERGDLGSWLNMPYLGGDETERYAVKAGGAGMTLTEFLRTAEASRLTEAQLEELGPKRRRAAGNGRAATPDVLLDQGPPCLQHLSATGFPEGTRNRGLFALGVFAKKKYPLRWKQVLEDMNQKFMSPPMPSEEVVMVQKSLEKKDYQYTCKEYPLSAHCNSGLCRGRKFGVGGDDDYPVITGLSVLDSEPPLWFLDIDGHRVEMTTDQLQSYTLFHKLCMEKLFICFKLQKQDTWLGQVSVAMRDAVRVEAPPEVGLTGKFFDLLEDFCENKHKAEFKEQILLGRPWHDEDEGRHYFRLKDLEKFLEIAGLKGYPRNMIITRIRQAGGDAHFFNLKGKGTNCWWVPATFTPIPTIEVPSIEGDPI